ncbi:N-acetylmuramoyl-L-alanine amidase [Streptacidiphilus sp. N1-12]|uniref:N-acetylmuramoyl-L-alanine amidase n=2 Tax=Streptacidiphilus alkalitolerans TaxID=3342712 RepID=A0ABV6WG29_9ACTN
MRTRVLVTAGVVLVAATGVAVAVNHGSGSGAAGGPGTSADSATGPIRTSVASLALTGGTGTDRVLTGRSTKPFSSVGVTWTDAHATLRGTVEVRTRSSATGSWGDWIPLEQDDTPDASEVDRPGVRGGTSPHWVGPSDGVQARVRAAKGVTALPAGLSVALVDPGTARSSADAQPAGFAMDADPTDSSSADPGDSTAPADPASADPTPTDTGTTPTDPGTPSATATAPDTGSPSPTTPAAAPTTTAPASPTPSATPWPSQLPSLAAAYPTGKGCTAVPAAQQSAPSPLPPATSSTIPTPTVVSRAGWGADECIRENGYPDYGSAVKVVFVHHTDDSNSYSCSTSAAMVRSVYAYHVQSEGWRDIGYNYLVDKCGTIFEGRFGGGALPVTGAQTLGFNTNSMGIAAIGTYTDLTGGDSKSSGNKGATPTKAMLGAIADLAAWKLGMSGINPSTGTGQLVEGVAPAAGGKFPLNAKETFKAISGHRDGFATDCPGNQLYTALATIRGYAVGPVTGLTVTSLNGGAAKSGTRYLTRGAATVNWTTATPGQVISGFDVLVDGVVKAHTNGLGTHAAITVGAGSHTVTVVATHITGSRATSTPVTLVSDTTAPRFSTAPSLALRTGAVSTTAVPVTLSWKATDTGALASVQATAPSAATFGPTTTGWNTNATPGRADLFTLRATDVAGNSAYASVTRTPSLVQETSAKRTGSWTKRTSSSYLGGASYSASAKNASISWTFTGRSVSWIVSRASTSGQAYVYVDGVKAALIDLRSSSTLYRQAVWAKSWSTSGKHTLKIVVVGTAKRPTVTTDGIAVLG